MTVKRSINSLGRGTWRDSRQTVPGIARGTLAMAAIVCSCAAVGCKSGMSMTKPSWWSFGGGGDTAKLASAPAFSGDAKKPSETNSPYPTTSTPNGYVITGSNAVGGSPAAQAAAPIGPVVYGSSSPPVNAAAQAPALPATAAPQAGGAAAQAGPYATLAGETIPPPGQPLPPIAPLSAAAAPPAAPASTSALPPTAAAAASVDAPAAAGPAYRTADASAPTAGYSSVTAASPPSAGPPSAGVADPRALEPAAGLQPAGLPSEAAAAAAGTGGTRYAAQSASRFTTGGSTPAAAASYGAYGQPPADAAFPPPEASLPAASQPASEPVMQPATPGLLPQSTAQPPVRRPDPGYRPFKTGSYRPSRTILADESGPVPGEVRTASYEETTAGSVQR